MKSRAVEMFNVSFSTVTRDVEAILIEAFGLYHERIDRVDRKLERIKARQAVLLERDTHAIAK